MRSAGGHEATRTGLWLPVLLVAAGLLAWWSSLGGAFVFDDNTWIVRNPAIRDLGSLDRLFEGTSRPVLKLTLALNHAVGGSDPTGYHVVNLAVHLLAGLALYGCVRRTLLLPRLRPRYGDAAPWLACAAALLWLLHPLQTQAVTYVVQRGESLMGLAYLATLYAAIRVEEGRRRRAWVAAAFLACLLGMGTKEVMVTAPVLVLLHDRTFAAGSFAAALRTRGALHGALAATWAVPLVMIGPETLFGGEFARPDLPTPDALRYALSQPAVLLHYLRLAIWPSPLCFDYGWPTVEGLREAWPSVLVMGAALVATGWLVARGSGAGFLLAWFFVILAPSSSVVPIADVAVEHRMYLPLAALCVGGVLLADRALARARTRAPWLGGLLVLLVAMGLGVATARRNLVYHDPVTLWQSVVEAAPGNARGHYNLGTLWSARGRKEEAIAAFRASLAIDPTESRAHYNLANALKATGELEVAVTHYREAAALAPRHALARMNLANTLQTLGRADEAIPLYREAVELRPRDARLRHNLGIALLAEGRSDEAVAELRLALEGRPRSASTRTKLGDALLRAGRPEEAVVQYRRALELDPGREGAERGLAAALEARPAPE